MGTQDISRSAFDPRKQYTGVRMQQGRVIVDDDWNEHARINEEDERRARVEIVGPAGSPDDGFRVDNPRVIASDQITFDIHAGTFYLGGLRLEQAADQPFHAQADWLQHSADEFATPTGERYDLVYLETCQVPVTAVEDSELFEVALGGPDTSTRTRLVQRVRLATDVGSDQCDEAWQALVARWKAGHRGTVTAEHQLQPDVKLTVGTTQSTGGGDLCSPQTVGGYLGAENQAIRVQLTGANQLTWGFDNAAPLYRIKVGADRHKLEMVTQPKDEAHWPISGQVVEVLPWAAVLPNGEKVAEIQGHVTRVDKGYNPDHGTLTLKDAVPTAGFDEWEGRPDKGELEGDGAYYYMRVWNRGADHASAPEIDFTPGTALDLGHTGLTVTITGPDRNAGDYWIIAARPETPNQVVPWDLETGRPPHGVRRFVAPLAVLHWEVGQGTVTATAHDCRPRFRPLTRQRTCCHFLVGDGVTSHGDFDSLEAAVAQLPDTGGQICLLPGHHRANVVLERRKNVTIRGCDRQTRVVPRSGQGDQPIFHVRDSRGITLEHLDLFTRRGTAVEVEGSEPDRLMDVEICHNRVVAGRQAVHVQQAHNVRIHHNILRVLDTDVGDVVVYLLAEDAVIADNDVAVVKPQQQPKPFAEQPEAGGSGPPIDPTDPCVDEEEFYDNRRAVAWSFEGMTRKTRDLKGAVLANPHQALGGIQIGSGSERVSVRDNEIRRGAGNGITLGSDLDPADLPTGEAAPEPKEEIHRIETSEGQIRGIVRMGDQPLSNVEIAFQGPQGPPTSTITEEHGFFVFDAPFDAYRVYVADPRYRISDIRAVRRGRASTHFALGTFYFITVVEVEPDVEPTDILAFIYGVEIVDNVIADMGLSGIGIPQVNLTELGNLEGLQTLVKQHPQLTNFLTLTFLFGIFSGFVVDLTIRGNRIVDCLRNYRIPEAEGTLVQRGVGGISLGLCDHLVIQENRIARNGVHGEQPVSGIFVLFAEQVEIARNEVVDNGPEGVQEISELPRGIWGGIVTLAASAASITARLGAGGKEPPGDHAARVTGNVVDQPIGRGLVLGAFGPVVVDENRFNSDAVGPGRLDGFGAGVLLINLGGLQNLTQASLNAQMRKGEGEVMETAVTGPARFLQPHPTIPGGDTLFNDNQIRVGAQGVAQVAQLILTADDLGFESNQSVVVNTPPMTMTHLETASGVRQINTLLLGVTLRATGSRFKEPFRAYRKQRGGVLSLLSLALALNNTSQNQGNHCIIAVSALAATYPQWRPNISTDNQSIVPWISMCKQIEENVNADPQTVAQLLLPLLYAGRQS